MLTLGPIAFLAPLLLVTLAALPVLWWLLRAVPPAPAKRAFPGVRLLMGLKDPERMPEKTPWWLLLLRMVALAAAILAFANPVLNPEVQGERDGPLLVLLDGGWASAPNWSARQAKAQDVLDRAARAGRPVAMVEIAKGLPQGETLNFRDAGAWAQRVAGLTPEAWAPDRGALAEWLESRIGDGFETVWLADGLAGDGDGDFLRVLQAAGPVTVISDASDPVALTSPRFEDGAVRAELLRTTDTIRPSLRVTALGPDPNGIERVLGETMVIFDGEGTSTGVEMDLPVELRNRVTRLVVPQERSAGAVALTDDGLKRRKVGIIAGAQEEEAARLNSPLFYIGKALETSADLIEAPLTDILLAAPDVIILADIATFAGPEREALEEWVRAGGLLIRFAGPRLAQSGEGQLEQDPLLPVRLRAGGRAVGGTMSWGAPKQLRAFPEDSPFFGLRLPDEVTVSSQVMAQPDPNLPERVLASLEDGTPLVTGRAEGDGRVVLFHVTANADWSNLPLSGLFVEMLERLAVSTRGRTPDAEALEGQNWLPVSVLDGFGSLVDPKLLAGVDGARLIEERPGPTMPPGLYEANDQSIAVNLFQTGDTLEPLGAMPSGVVVEAMGVVEETFLKPWLLVVALLLLAADILATLWLAGRLTGPRVVRGGTVAVLALGLAGVLAPYADAQELERDDAAAVHATSETVLAYVETGEARVDNISRAGLAGLSRVLTRRTAIEPAEPMAVNLETDEIAFLPFLYWPISELQQIPSDAAYARLNAYLRSGGMILFDTQDANLGGRLGAGTPNGRMLQRLAAKLDVPPLEPAPDDHVLTRTFYLLQDFPGRFANTDIWVEAMPDIEEVEGMPFRNLNDGVTPVIIGANDWAGAWAEDASGNAMLPVGRGSGGARQREMAYRFGVNLIMHVMTGNYKSDQVHVPALLERLGN
ncbi:DUF4159 domain-containing protein [Algicella marina]|uniref:DUF4159 domain-containing protein n=1 Tax=Algicella marina TaxID=2683284 RepID=A0A6P1T3T1_9RHOB|nr:DUF4159 domain-containing protein [Algicella marina]QHQ36136.1 DUF4159 domain-containing protein [Algicella marina]